jgi:hypothetical protein
MDAAIYDPVLPYLSMDRERKLCTLDSVQGRIGVTNLETAGEVGANAIDCT